MILDIDSWLNGIGLGQYAATFRSNEIDGRLLSGLNGDDLKEMGITALGHRKMLLKAIAALCAGLTPTLPRQPQPTLPPRAQPPSAAS